MNTTDDSIDAAAFSVDLTRCSRCGACTLFAPTVFELNIDQDLVVRPPTSGEETRLARAALFGCPKQAIRLREEARALPASGGNQAVSFDTFLVRSEATRWRYPDVSWTDFDASQVPPWLPALVREMASSELTTFSATQRFMQAFEEDVEFTQWLSIWFYEETRHSHALLEWLDRSGEGVRERHEFIANGRVSEPFMRSKIGTLTTNVISELTAAAAYQSLFLAVNEPVLRFIAGGIAADEARHAAAFFRFAWRRMQRAEDTERERLDVAKVLHFWLDRPERVAHPIHRMLERVQQEDSGREALRRLDLDTSALQRRIIRMLGLLMDAPVESAHDVRESIRILTTARQRR